ncbi:TRAP transporter small permease subunit [Acidimangrovimonas sediminis]|uniref:TRAP transporter small permease subunit n=1 Tax=Acidimangrovimonas sediminis TaxID=2056283 RepID=UPI000C80D990|nr:TRAP transporter small permease [Acidimangrovimonas sediminis]
MDTLVSLRHLYGRLLALCGLIAGLMTFAVMCLVCANVLMRYAFNAPIPGTLELTESALPIMIFLSVALTQHGGGHIKVTLLTQHLSPIPRRALQVFAMAAGAVVFGWAAWAGWEMAMKAYSYGELERGAISFPLWPVKFVVFFGLALLAVQFLIDAVLAALGWQLPEMAEVLE